MVYQALACDFDNTLAIKGQVSETTIDALWRWRAAERLLILVTGRHLGDLKRIFPALDLFHMAILENGSLLYQPQHNREHLLGQTPPEALVQGLRAHGVEPLIVGQGVIGTRKPHDETARHLLQESGIPWQVILNKQDVMILPPGINKASGMRAALDMLSIAPSDVVGIGDAENDFDLMQMCGYKVAVANALPVLKEQVDLVTAGAYGDGVTELIDSLLAADSSGQERLSATA